MSQGLAHKIILLQDANIAATKNIANENSGYTISHLNDTLNISHDLSAELVSITEQLRAVLAERNSEFNSSQGEMNLNVNYKYGGHISEMVDLLIHKIKELKRSVSYLCAASDMTAPGRSRKGSYKDRKNKKTSQEQISTGNDKTTLNDNTSDEEDHKKEKIKYPRRKEKLVKSKSEDNQIINYAKLQVTSFEDQRKERTQRCYQLNRVSKSQAHLNFQSLDNTSKLDDSSDVSVEMFKKNIKRKLQRSKRVSESCSESNKTIEETVEQKQVPICSEQVNSSSNVIIPTQILYLDATTNSSNVNEIISSSPISVFVQTTRKVFTPFTSDIFDKTEDNDKQTINSSKQNEISGNKTNERKFLRKSNSPCESPLLTRRKLNETTYKPVETSSENNENSRPSTPSHLPPLPNSPISQRRDRHLIKETSPAIRMMIARYNQKLSEHEAPGTKSAGSSGSASPVAWRSPVFERRVKAQTEKYEEEVTKSLLNSSGYSPLFMRKQVQKSASVGVISPVKKQVTSPEITPRGASLDSNASPKLIRGILKSTSVGSMKTNITPENPSKPEVLTEEQPISKLIIPSSGQTDPIKLSPNLQERATKLQKAKEEFLLQKTDAPIAGPSSAPYRLDTHEDCPIKYPTRNRLSQVSFGSESSCDDLKTGLLVKSASAGMINVDEATYEQFRPEIHSQGYVSLPRATKKKDGKFGISSLASKFRKVKMRRAKDPTQMNTVSTLCRQSLVVDITGNTTEEDNEDKKNSPSTSKTSWIRNPAKIFKPKDPK